MRIFIIVALIAMISSCSKNDVNLDQLIDKKEGMTLKDSGELYSGSAYELYNNGKRKYEITFKRGVPNGPVLEWYKNGEKKSEGRLKMGKQHGSWIEWHEEGVVTSEKKYKNGKLVFDDPYPGMSEDDIDNAIFLEDHGDIMYVRKGKGEKKLFTGKSRPNAPIDKFNGESSEYGNYKEGKRDGLWIFWSHSGIRSEKNYKDGQLDGIQLYWNKDGNKVKEINYIDGELIEGSAKYWDSKGESITLEGVNEERLESRLREVEIVLSKYENELDSEEIMYLKGGDAPYTGKTFGFANSLRLENYKDGKKNGVQIHWHENGQKSLEGNYKDGKEDGLMVEWYKNGQKSIEYNYEDGKPDGLCVNWHENGKKMSESNWNKGEQIGGSQKYWNSKGEPVDTWQEAK